MEIILATVGKDGCKVASKEDTAGFQRDVDAFVGREVGHNVSMLISELASKEEYQEELLNICIQYQCSNECAKDECECVNEALEHWIVSDWLADALEKRGEMVTKDFYNLTIWGRCTSGQAISIDDVIVEIYRELMN